MLDFRFEEDKFEKEMVWTKTTKKFANSFLNPILGFYFKIQDNTATSVSQIQRGDGMGGDSNPSSNYDWLKNYQVHPEQPAAPSEGGPPIL